VARRGRPLRRLFLLALLAFLVWLFLQWNRWWPGSWPGGGDSGSRRTPASPNPDPSRLAPSSTPPPPAAVPEDVVRVLLLDADGSRMPGVTVQMGNAVGLTSADGAGLDLSIGAAGTRVFVGPARSGPSGRMTHTLPRRSHGDTWVLRWPSASLPESIQVHPERRAEVVVRRDGRPVAGATVTIVSGGGDAESQRTTDDAGRARAESVVGVFRVHVTAADRQEAYAYGSTSSPEPLVVDLDVTSEIATTFQDPDDHAPLEAKALRVVSADGTTRTLERPDGGFRDLRMRVPHALASTQAVEVEVEGRPLLRVPLESLGAVTNVPRGRAVEVVVRDEAGKPVPHAQVEARGEGAPGSEPGRFAEPSARATTDDDGRARLALRADRAADLVARAPGLAPGAARVEAGSVSEAAVTLPKGVPFPVLVVDGNGEPIAGAKVIVLSRAGDATDRREVETGRDGKAEGGPVVPGRVEVWAHAAGKTWETRVGSAGTPGAESPLRLQLSNGHRLHLVVEDPYGVPLAGVRVSPSEPLYSSHGSRVYGPPDAAPWTTDEHGVLVVEEARYVMVLRLSKPGYASEELSEVYPDRGRVLATMVRKP
jgi:uncharacterized GH25 family protein